MKRRVYIFTIALIMSSLLLPVLNGTAASAITRDCDDNAVVHCGTLTLDELKSNYKGDIKAVYTYFGISSGMLSATTRIKDGYVTKSGEVLIGDEVVASDAVTVGREDMPGSSAITAGGTTFYQRPPSVSFGSDKLDAFVFVDNNGAFVAAVIKSCGNPVKATPKAKPAAACSGITANKISRNEYTFTVKASMSGGAEILGYKFAVTGPKSVDIEPVRAVKDTYTSKTVTFDEPGTYKIVATVATSEGDQTSADCATSVTIAKQTSPEQDVEVCNPATGKIITVKKTEEGNYKPKDDEACKPKTNDASDLPSTGPSDMIVGIAGLGGLTAAGYYYRASRQHVRDLLKK